MSNQQQQQQATTTLPASSMSRSNPSCGNLPTNALVLPATAQLQALLTIIRDVKTQRGEFVFTSDRIIRLLVEEGLNHLPVVSHTVTTPLGIEYQGVSFQGKICGVSIMRAGEAMEAGLRECARSVRIGKILIQRDEATAKPKLFYAKLPEDIDTRYCLLLDPMLATGGSAMQAIDVLLSHGVQEEKILFLNLISSPEGLKNVCEKYPKLKIITAWVDEGLDKDSFIVPGLGDFGDRYFL
ncbi:putative uracil phosphoribosyltransferase 1 [Filobasidium floriforme]|uniref:putative uracil phosphoribosyltransferase 1 n=1 Tax=Filobasidium floriforme TaxID=5210 RepID=UPI001E8CA265|nr:putative uracil phosphoribosyltransferase 1 [Filobasidium floriforme]KAH8086427.1 putative uracil phosphoribosyltransferase 1 [Filobasidium floriforme]